MTNDAVMAAVACPQCGAAAGEKCRGTSGVHPKRRGRAEMLHGWAENTAVHHGRAERTRWREARSTRRPHRG